MPANVQAEEALLGALLANNSAYERCCDILEPFHFFNPVNAMLYAEIERRLLEGRLVDAVSLRHDLANQDMLGDIGGVDYLVQLLSAMVGIINVAEYARAIRDAWIKRELVSIGEAIVNRALGDTTDATEQLDAGQQALAALQGDQVSRNMSTWTLGQVVSKAIASADAIYRGAPSPLLRTGLATVDAAIGGLWPDDLTVLAGIPGAGKTSLAVQIGESVARRAMTAALTYGATPEEAQKVPGVAMFSLEMSGEQLGARVAAFLAGVPVDTVLNGTLDMDTAARLARAESDAARLPFRGYDCRSISKSLLSAYIRRHLRRQPELLVIVDHLLVIEGDTARQNESGLSASLVGQVARGLKKLAWELHVPMLVLSHASRASASRINPRPVQGDLKWGGEGDADTLMFVHRPIMFDDGSVPARKKREEDGEYNMRVWKWERERKSMETRAELIVAKRRMGKPGLYLMRFDGPTASFSPWQRDGAEV